ncbi:sulfate transporter family-domain-containing protein [Fusarium redolens]|uniref:Sulfate transporter family-domain-containing protein n=1 Tax=Fusarium redolens TaxID=48865 RepID=A0A9P9GKI4_FUSRE|nr:sulfate transporter family-domain-containing protein [Fusarium redolens]KAH7241150.1 sulfate transporter family-domain-containing protein [Fusarium redolens]
MAKRPSHSRTNSGTDHRPTQPSALRQALNAHDRNESENPTAEGSTTPTSAPAASPPGSPGHPPGATINEIFANETTPLIDGNNQGSNPRRGSVHPAHPGVCSHGTFSPRPMSPTLTMRSTDEDGSETAGSGTHIPVLDNAITTIVGHEDWKKWLKKRMRTKTMGHSSMLAEQAGFEDTAFMYLAYYVPCLNWMRQYKASYLRGDFVAAITMASFYLPMALSLAANLAHVPPIHGLYAFVFNPFIYALLGSCPQMVVGPEAAGSLLVGTVVKQNVGSGEDEDNDLLHAQICGIVAGMAGAMVLIAGLARLGFMDSVLSRPFLRGFISAIGFVIAVDQLIPELGLAELADDAGVSHGSPVEKIRFIINNIHEAHGLTFAIAGISFLVIMICRELKNRLQPRYPGVAYIPDRFVVVVVSAILCWRLDWENQGVEILGTVKAANGQLLAFQWPFKLEHMPHIRSAMATSFLIALLGFFESSVAAKSLGSSETIQGIQLSANREMIALGIANMVGGCFMSLPAFGGYGRSKVNKSTGGKSPASSMFLSIISLLSIFFLLPYFYYLPKPVLSAMISVVAYSLIEEAPHDISFFLKIRGWTELGLMAVIFLATMFYSLTLGMAFGVGLSMLMVIKHSTRPRIQILGRIPGTNRFENAEGDKASLEFVEGCLIVKIPEPLTFANTGELKSRLRRLELYGTSKAHPALPRLRSTDMNRNVIFDIHGVTSMDGSGTQVLTEIVRNYHDRGVRVYFSRCPVRKDHPVWRLMLSSGIVEMAGERHFVNDVEEALRLTEYEESIAGESSRAQEL